MSSTGTAGDLPLYLTQSGRERDDFLRALGVTEYDDINLFHLLCSYAVRRGVPKVQIRDFLTAVAGWARSRGRPNLIGGPARTAFRRLTAALERNGYAATSEDGVTLLLRNGDRRAGRGERAVSEIQKAYTRMQADPTARYPGSAEIKVPPTALTTILATEFTRDLIAAQAQSSKILRIGFTDDVDLLATPDMVPELLDIARKRICFYIQNNPRLYSYVIAEIHRIPQLRHLSDQKRLYTYLEQRVETPPLFWMYLCLAVARSRTEDLIEAKLRPGRLALYQSAYLLHGYWQNEHRAEQEQRQRKADEDTVIHTVERTGKGFTTEDLCELRDEAGQPLKSKYPDCPGFVSALLDRLQTEGATAGTVPVLVSLGDQWIHRACLLPMLEEELRTASEYCRRVVETDFKRKLYQSQVNDPALLGDDAFADTLSSVVEARCTGLAALLKKPQLIHLLITELSATNAALYRTHGLIFVALDNPVFRRTDQLLGLEREQIVSHIISGMSLLRRFLLRRKFRLRRGRADPRRRVAGVGALPGVAATRPEPGTRAGRGGGAPDGPTTRRLGHNKPDTVRVERRRQKGPKTMDEAMGKLKEAMSKRRPA